MAALALADGQEGDAHRSARDRTRWTYDDEHVRWAVSVVDDMGVLEQLEEWRAEARRGAAGPKETFPLRTLLVAMILCARTGLPMLASVLRDVLFKHISTDMRRELGLAAPPRRNDTRAWDALASTVRHRLHGMLGVMDPSPFPKNRLLKPTEFAARTRDLSPAHVEERYDRLCWFANRILDASIRELDPVILARWRGSVSVDATHLPLFSRGEVRPRGKGTQPVTTHSVDPDGGWYYREGDHGDGSTDLVGGAE